MITFFFRYGLNLQNIRQYTQGGECILFRGSVYYTYNIHWGSVIFMYNYDWGVQIIRIKTTGE